MSSGHDNACSRCYNYFDGILSKVIQPISSSISPGSFMVLFTSCYAAVVSVVPTSKIWTKDRCNINNKKVHSTYVNIFASLANLCVITCTFHCPHCNGQINITLSYHKSHNIYNDRLR